MNATRPPPSTEHGLHSAVAEIHLTYLNGLDVDRLAMTDQEILSAVEG